MHHKSACVLRRVAHYLPIVQHRYTGCLVSSAIDLLRMLMPKITHLHNLLHNHQTFDFIYLCLTLVPTILLKFTILI